MDEYEARYPLLHITRDVFDTIADAYQGVILRGDFLPYRNMERDIAEAEWERDPHGFPLYNPEKDVENTEIDESYGPDR